MLHNEDYLRLCGVELMVFSSGSVGVRRKLLCLQLEFHLNR